MRVVWACLESQLKTWGDDATRKEEASERGMRVGMDGREVGRDRKCGLEIGRTPRMLRGSVGLFKNNHAVRR